MTQNNNNQYHIEEDEIDLIALARTVWEGRKTIVKTTLVFMAIGLFIAFFSANEYTASTVILPQSSESKIGGGLGGLAAMAGINMGNMGGEGIQPILYPKIAQSVPFQKELIQTPLNFTGVETAISYQEYYKNYEKLSIVQLLKKYSIGLPGLLLKALKGEPTKVLLNENSQLLSITAEEEKLFKKIQEQLSIEYNDDEGFVSLVFTMPEALVAAQMAQKAQDLLQQNITKFKIQKATEQLQFVSGRYAEKEKEFKQKQTTLAKFQDANRGLNSALSQTHLLQLQAEYELAFQVYSELAKQLETQKIQVKEDTPVFTVIEPVVVPIEKSSARKSTVLIFWTLLGVVFGISIVFGERSLKTIQSNWNKVA